MAVLVQKYISAAWSLQLVSKINKHASQRQKHRIIELNFYLFDMLKMEHITKVSGCLERIAGDDPVLKEIVKKNRRTGTVNKIFWGCAATIAVMITVFIMVIACWIFYDMYHGIKYEPKIESPFDP